MAQINTDLEILKTARDNMKTALEEKGQTVTKDIRTYAEAISNISTGGSGDVKLFETVEKMQQDENPQDGDLAVVYKEELINVTAESEFDSCIFPNEVVLDEAFTDNIYGRFRAVESSSSYFDGMVDMSSSSFRFDGYGESSEIRVEYESEDGITYTRTDGGDELQEFGVVIKWEDYGERFNSVIGNFMKINGNYFNGLYKYGRGIDDETLLGARITETTVEDLDGSDGYTNATYTYDVLDYVTCKKAINALNNTEYAGRDYNLLAYDRISNKFRFYIVINNTGYQGCYVCYYDDDAVWRITLSNNGAVASLNYLEYDEINGLSSLITVPVTDTRGLIQATGSCNTYSLDNIDIIAELEKSNGKSVLTRKYINARQIFTSRYLSLEESPNFDNNVTKYFKANTQLDTTSDYVYEKTFYGKNGVENGNLSNNVSSTLDDNNVYIYSLLQSKYDKLTPLVITEKDDIDTNIISIPSKSDGTCLIDISNVSDINALFSDCKKLKIINNLDISNFTTLESLFLYCEQLEYVTLTNTSHITNFADLFAHTNIVNAPEMDTSSATTMVCMFEECTSLVNIPLYDTSQVTSFMQTFNDCNSLIDAPALNTSSATIFRNMFIYCRNLVNVPVYNTSLATDMQKMFYSCTKLSQNSLNNILAMCTNATKITSNKTLKYIGLSQTQATTCQSLSNYQDFVDAGWTTGY